MALKVNGDPHPHREGLTITELLAEKSFTYPLKTVFVNGARIPKDRHDTTTLADGDDVQVIHLMSGG